MKVNKRIFIVVAGLLAILILVCGWIFPKKRPLQIIPIKIAYGLPVINVNIQEHEIQLMLNLGAHFSALTKEAIEKIQLNKELKTTNSMDIFGKKTIHRVFSACKILIGNYLLPYLEFNEIADFNEDFGDQIPKTLIYGHIGREPFLDKVLFIDRKKQLCMVDQAYFNQKMDPEKYHPGKWIEANFILDKGLGISLSLTINSEDKRDLVLDTGSNISMINDNSLKPFNFNDKKKEMSLKLSDGSSLGMFSFYLFDSSSAELQGILGFDFFDCYMVCFDFLNKKVFLKKYD
ncbi:MAG TPA: hypothetical protein VGZ69_01280 [Candidatus Rhabdochlamydia sp.]|nr:hypothetical protein [Candidatus Rhabdochlamydia sp.]